MSTQKAALGLFAGATLVNILYGVISESFTLVGYNLVVLVIACAVGVFGFDYRLNKEMALLHCFSLAGVLLLGIILSMMYSFLPLTTTIGVPLLGWFFATFATVVGMSLFKGEHLFERQTNSK